jgi:hypothetical protein
MWLLQWLGALALTGAVIFALIFVWAVLSTPIPGL